MKRKLVLGLVALAGGLTVVGSGFASWYFGATDVTGAAAVGYHTTDMNNGIGSLESNYTLATSDASATALGASDKLYLCLDQGHYANKVDATCGVSFHKLATTATGDSDFSESTLVSKLGVKYTLPKESLITLQNAGVTQATLTATFTLHTEYLKVNSDAANESFVTKSSNVVEGSAITGNIDPTTGVLTYEVVFSLAGVATTSDYVASFDFDVSTTNYTTSSVNKMISYAADKKPTTSEAYSSMKSALSSELASANVLDVAYSLNVATTETAVNA